MKLLVETLPTTRGTPAVKRLKKTQKSLLPGKGKKACVFIQDDILPLTIFISMPFLASQDQT
jgi:hypothetical protein